MNIIDKIRKYATSKGYYKGEEEEYEEEYEDEDVDERDYERERERDHDKYSRRKYEEEDRMTLPPITTSRSSRTTSIYGGGASSDYHTSKIVDISANVKMQLVLSAPQSVADAMEVCDFVLSNKIVSISLEGLDHATSQRIVDFLSGVAYALGGDIQSTGGTRNFIIAPQSVDITGHLKEELKASGVLFSMKSGTK